MNLYRAFDIWEQYEERTAVRYRCFEILANGRFFVQSADFYRLPFNKEHATHHEEQFVELFLERDDNDLARKSFMTIEAAIADLKQSFDGTDETRVGAVPAGGRTDESLVH